ncbi:MAG: hypothetical protein MI919_06300, partial [Holophagales bacterium]|nr:hypothetical protein [Holophagales bacterium]
WGPGRHLSRLRLETLGEDDSLLLLSSRLELARPSGGRSPLGKREMQDLVARSSGIPRHLEALLEGALGHGAYFPGSRVPSTLFEPLMARLDRLGTAKDLARAAALFPDRFSDTELRRLRLLDPTRLEHEIERLLDGRIWSVIRDRPDSRTGDRTYGFLDPLLRETALASWLPDDRAELERRVDGVRGKA